MPTTQKLNEDLVFILERQNTILESKKTDSDDYVLEGTAAVFGKENNNNRIYIINKWHNNNLYYRKATRGLWMNLVNNFPIVVQ